MAQNGGTRHTGTASPGPSQMRADRITLNQPRPDGLRNGNYYTETPLRSYRAPAKADSSKRNGRDAVAAVHRASAAPGATTTTAAAAAAARARSDAACAGSAKEKNGDDGSGAIGSIVCTDCGKCKCMACRQPRSLPSKWICNSKYECSAEAMLDTVTCMCCVKGVFYHCTKDYDMDDDVSCADRPCSCASERRCVRWSCMGALSLLMPCLLCYWPLRGCLVACETCYARYHSRGCQCYDAKSKLQLTNKRLLDPNAC